jgi:MFS family permease
MPFTSRWSDVSLIAGARGVSVCGDFLAATTLALILQQAGHGGLAVSGLLLAASLPLALLAPVAGRVADRADSRTVLVVAGLAQAAVCAALAFATHPVLIIALVAVLSCGLAITQPTTAALLPGMVRKEDLAKASGILQTSGLFGMLIAPALAGILVGQTGSRLPLLLDAGSYLALVVAGFLVRTRRRGGTSGAGPVTAVTWRLRDDHTLLAMVVALTAVVAGVGAINVVEVFFIRETLGASTTVFGLISASWMVGMLVGSFGFGRLPRRRITVPGVLLLAAGSCVPVLIAAAVPSAGWLVPLWILGGICNGGINVFTTVIVAGRAPTAAHGRAYAALSASVQGGSLLGLALAGPLVEHFEPRVLVAALAIAGLVAAAACAPAVRLRPEPPSRPAIDSDPRVRDSVGA